MRCQRCGLPDPHRGQGDGIGSCECRRCECCGVGPEQCDCGQDWDANHIDDEYYDDAGDPLCNDLACDYRRARVAKREAKEATE